ncbi:hypothetical protein [Escherichia coli]|nr:hypothetical protein [Escherichia coli]
MKKIKFTGLNASGQTHQKIRNGDIFRGKKWEKGGFLFFFLKKLYC